MFWSKVDRLDSVNITLHPSSLLFILASLHSVLAPYYSYYHHYTPSQLPTIIHIIIITLRPSSLLFILSSFQKTFCLLSFGYHTCYDSCCMDVGEKPPTLHSIDCTWMAGTIFLYHVV